MRSLKIFKCCVRSEILCNRERTVFLKIFRYIAETYNTIDKKHFEMEKLCDKIKIW